MPGASPSPADVPVCISTLGRFLVEVHGAPLQRSGRTRQKPFELLKFLVAMGGSAPISDLTEAVFPDADGDKAVKSFYTNKTRLGHELGVQPLLVRDRWAVVQRDVCWVDALAFPDAIERATGAVESADLDEAWRLMQAALALYRGPFLPGEFEPPEMLAARERLHAMFLWHVESLGRALFAAGQPGRAVELYRRGLDIDDETEELYRGLLEGYRQLGRVAEGVAIYQRCARVLRTKFGIAPSSQIEELHRTLLAMDRERAPPPPPEAAGRTPTPPAPPAGAAPGEPGRTAPPAALVATDGERRNLTTVCHVLSGFAAAYRHHDPEVLDQTLTRIRGTLDEVAAEFHGVVSHAVRDEVVLQFGIPRAREDDARRAVLAAQEAHRRIRELPPLAVGDGEGGLRLRTGVEVGRVLLKPQEDGGGGVSTAGDSVNHAAWLARQAADDEILLGDRAQSHLWPYFRTEAVALSGEPGGSGYRVLAFKGDLKRLEVSALEGFTPHSGRSAELRILEEALAAARAGRGRLVSVVGEAGVGKSRLIHEFCRAHADAVVQLRAECQPHGESTPYLPFQELLRRGLNLREGERPEVQRRRILRILGALEPSLAGHVPYCLRLLSIPGEAAQLPASMTAEELRRGITNAVAAVLTVVLRRQPMLVVLEDLHWADEASITTLRNLTTILPQYPLLLIVTYRPSVEIRWLRESHHLHIDLGPLEVADVAAMVRYLLGSDSLSGELVERIHEHTEGNPFFVEEVCRTLKEQRSIAIEDGHARLAREAAWPEIPEGVHAVVSSRLGGIAAESLKVLRIASVIGPTFSMRILSHVSPAGAEPFRELEDLAEAQLIQQVQVVPELRYRFRHNITQRVVYDSLLMQQRRMLHLRVGEAIEQLYPERIEEHLESLAHHYARSTDADKGLEYLERAGQKAARIYSLQDARTHFRTALALLNELPQTAQNALRRIDAAIRLAMVSFYRPSRGLLQELEAGRAEAERIGDARRHAQATFLAGTINYALAHHRAALDAFAHCLELPTADDDMRALATNYLGRIHFYLTDIAAAARYLEEGIGTLEERGNYVEAANSMTILACLHGFCGRIAEGRALAERVTALGTEVGNPSLVAVSQVSLGLVAGYAGSWEEARAAGLRARETAHSVSNTIAEGMGTWCAGFANAMTGDAERGILLMREGIQTAESTESELAMGGMTAELARVCAVEERFEEAEAYARKACRLVEGGADRLGELILPFAEAMLAAHRRPRQVKAAKAIMERGLQACEERGARLWLAINHYYYALLMVRLRQPGTAGRQLERALALFGELRMPWWKRKAAALRRRMRGA